MLGLSVKRPRFYHSTISWPEVRWRVADGLGLAACNVVFDFVLRRVTWRGVEAGFRRR